MTIPEKSRNPLQGWVQVVRARPRLFLAILLGLGVVALLPAEWWLATRSLVAWDIALALYLVLAFRLMTKSDVNRINWRFESSRPATQCGLCRAISPCGARQTR